MTGVLLGGVVIAVAGSLVAGFAPWRTRTGGSGNDGSPASAQTAVVTRTDLSDVQTLTGDLGYGAAHGVKASSAGIITWLPAVGATVTRGQPLYRIDDRPVPMFYAAVPLYRRMAGTNLVGRDVRVVADNLKALGYSIGRQPAAGRTVIQTLPADSAAENATASTGAGTEPAASSVVSSAVSSAVPSAAAVPSAGFSLVVVKQDDGVLTPALVTAIKAWQTPQGVPPTGIIDVGDIVVAAGAVRVSAVQAQVGDSATGTLMSITGTTKVVTVMVDASDSGTITGDEPVTVTLPTNATVPGRVSEIGTSVQGSDATESGPNALPKLTVLVSLSNSGRYRDAVRKLDAAAVQVEFVTETHKDVLAVPVGALLALREGGYAVQVQNGDLVAVKLGLFANGLVEISGAGITEGIRVVTTS